MPRPTSKPLIVRGWLGRGIEHAVQMQVDEALAPLPTIFEVTYNRLLMRRLVS